MKTRNGIVMKLMLFCAALVMAIGANAQPPQGPPDGDKAEKIESLKRLYISEKLNLTPAEAEKFWPIYNQWHNDMKALRQNFFPNGKGEVKLSAEQQLDFEQKKLDLKKKYKVQFEGVLGKDKVNTLYGLEEEFKKKLQELRDQKQQQRGANPSPGGQGPAPGAAPRGGGGRGF